MKLVLRPLREPASEYAEVTEEPVPYTLTTYFEVRSLAFPDRPTLDRLPVSVRLAAVGKEIRERLLAVSDVVRRLEAMEWGVRLEGDDIVVTSDLSAEEGWQALRRQGISDHLLPYLEQG
ncbi:MAG: hypothetical protein ACREOL_10120, partial [Candidatus Dormibacteria bacterium]